MAGVIDEYVAALRRELDFDVKLAERIASNTALTNFAITHVLPRIAEIDPGSGYAVEALISSIAQADAEAKSRLTAFLEGRAGKVTRPE